MSENFRRSKEDLYQADKYIGKNSHAGLISAVIINDTSRASTEKVINTKTLYECIGVCKYSEPCGSVHLLTDSPETGVFPCRR